MVVRLEAPVKYAPHFTGQVLGVKGEGDGLAATMV
jgi:hypothetical protein